MARKEVGKEAERGEETGRKEADAIRGQGATKHDDSGITCGTRPGRCLNRAL